MKDRGYMKTSHSRLNNKKKPQNTLSSINLHFPDLKESSPLMVSPKHENDSDQCLKLSRETRGYKSHTQVANSPKPKYDKNFMKTKLNNKLFAKVEKNAHNKDLMDIGSLRTLQSEEISPYRIREKKLGKPIKDNSVKKDGSHAKTLSTHTEIDLEVLSNEEKFAELTLEDKFNLTNAENESLKQVLFETSQTLAEVEKDYKRELYGLNKQIEKLKIKLCKISSESKENSEKAAKELEDSHKAFQESLYAKDEIINDLKAQLKNHKEFGLKSDKSELNKAQEGLKDLNGQILSLTNQNKFLSTEGLAAKKLLNQTLKDIESEKTKHNALQGHISNLENLKQENKELTEKIKQLEAYSNRANINCRDPDQSFIVTKDFIVQTLQHFLGLANESSNDDKPGRKPQSSNNSNCSKTLINENAARLFETLQRLEAKNKLFQEELQGLQLLLEEKNKIIQELEEKSARILGKKADGVKKSVENSLRIVERGLHQARSELMCRQNSCIRKAVCICWKCENLMCISCTGDMENCKACKGSAKIVKSNFLRFFHEIFESQHKAIKEIKNFAKLSD